MWTLLRIYPGVLASYPQFVDAQRRNCYQRGATGQLATPVRSAAEGVRQQPWQFPQRITVPALGAVCSRHDWCRAGGTAARLIRGAAAVGCRDLGWFLDLCAGPAVPDRFDAQAVYQHQWANVAGITVFTLLFLIVPTGGAKRLRRLLTDRRSPRPPGTAASLGQ